jgi:hypothetical protein
VLTGPAVTSSTLGSPPPQSSIRQCGFAARDIAGAACEALSVDRLGDTALGFAGVVGTFELDKAVIVLVGR